MAAASALALAACGSSGGGSASSRTGKVTLTWWTTATAGQLKTVWQQAATAFHAAHPNVTIQVEPLQNEAFTTKVPPALASSNPPDIYQQWGGGQEATQIPSGKVADLTKLSSGWIGQVGSAAQAWQVNGKQYGVPYDLHTVGFWYRKDLFAKAAMELQGDWDPGVMAPLTSDKKLNSELGWFPFPAITGGAGSPTTTLGGGDGFSCTTPAAEPACAQFLQYIDSAPVQKKVVAANVGLPANPAAASALSLPALKQVLAYNHAAPYVQTYFDIAFPTSVGQALDAAIATYFAGQGTPQSIITAVNQAKSQ